MHTRQERLLGFLRHCERDDLVFTAVQADDAAGYKRGTIRTYIQKGLLGPWIFKETASPGYRARGLVNLPPDMFAAAMSQKTRRGFTDAESWQKQVRELVAAGMQRGYSVADVLADLLRDIRESTPRAKRTS